MKLKRICTFVLVIAMLCTLLTDAALFAAASDGGTFTIAEFNNNEAISAFENTYSKTVLQTRSSRPGGNDAYALFTVKPFEEQYIRLYDDNIDISSYKYLNAWVYAPKAKDAGISFLLYDEVAGRDGAEEDNFLTPSPYQTNIEFKGWKLVSFDISGAGEKLARLDLSVNGQKLDEYTGKYAALWHEKGSFGIERIWLSEDEPEYANEVPGIEVKPVVTPDDGDIVIKDFNTKSAVDSVTPTNGAVVVANTENNNLYGMNMRIKWDRAVALKENYKPIYAIPDYSSEWQNGSRSYEVEVFSASGDNKIQGLTDDSYINLWIYNPQIRRDYNGQYAQIGLQIFTGSSVKGTETSGANNYKIAGIIANWTGWKLVSIRIGDLPGRSKLGNPAQSDDTGFARGNITEYGIHKIKLLINYNNGEVSLMRTEDFTESQLERGFRGGEYVTVNGESKLLGFNPWSDVNNFIDIDRIWISDGKPVWEIVGDDAVLELSEFNNENSVAGLENDFSRVTLSDENSRQDSNASYAEFDVKAYKEQTAVLFKDGDEDLSEFNFLNAWVYSPEMSGGGLSFVGYDGEGNMSQKSFNLNFKGWRLISLDISDCFFELNKLELKVNGFKVSDYTGKYASLWHNDGFFGIEKIGLSRLKPDGSGLEPVIEAKEKLDGGQEAIWSVDFNSTEEIDKLEPEKNLSVTPTAENKNLYGMSARFAWNNAIRYNESLETPAIEVNEGTDEWSTSVYTCGVDFFKAGSAEDKIQGLTENSYLNMWIYNPQIKRTVNGEFSQIPVQIFTGSAEADENEIKNNGPLAYSGSVNYKIIGIIANWTGWKLVSVRLGDVTNTQSDDTGLGSGDILEYGIHRIYLCLNDRPEATKDRGDFTEEQLNRGWRGGLGSGAKGFNSWCDRFNFIDIDKVWISTSKPVDEFKNTAFSHDGKEYVSPLDKSFTITMNNPVDASYIDDVKKLEITMENSKLPVDRYSVSVNEANNEITVTFANDLECGKKYSIIIPSDIRDVYTNLYSGVNAFSFNTMTNEMVVLKDSVNEKTESDIKAVLESYNLANNTGFIAKVLYEQKPFNDYDEIISMIKLAEDKLSELNEIHWSGICDFFEDNKALLFATETEAYNEYLDLSERNQNSVNQLLVKALPVESFDELRKELENALDDYDKGGQSGGSGSSGGGGGSSKPSTSTVTFGNDIIKDVISENAVKTVIFDDLEAFAWAEDNIMSLYEAGVIATAEDGKFRPKDNVKREEFVKMLVASLGIEVSEDESGFTDSRADAWFEPYISAAKKAGIAMGKEDGSFGVGENITRQDMAVMVQRAVAAVGKSLTVVNEELVFEDSSDISAYAKAAVSYLQMSGIINGVTDTTFEPLANANRAQAATIIAKILEKIG